MKKLYVIVEYNFANGGYLQYAVDGMVFEDERAAEEYMNTKPFNYAMSVEELDLYREN